MWWLDEHTTRLLIDFIGLGEFITVSVDPGPPRVLSREQVRGRRWYGVVIRRVGAGICLCTGPRSQATQGSSCAAVAHIMRRLISCAR